jgi:FkbM family methyltransferase
MHTLEDSLKGGYQGLHGEVAIEDCYRLKQVKFVPDVVFDIGANIGIFTRFARSVFPDAYIIAVEPDSNNTQVFKTFTKMERIVLIQTALGKGRIFRRTPVANGAHESYLSIGLGCPEFEMYGDVELEEVTVGTMMLDQILKLQRHLHRTKLKSLVKIDCEGAENAIWEHKPSMEALRQCHYIAIELHMYAVTVSNHPKVVEVTEAALESLKATHDCERVGFYFLATKKS